MSPRGLVRFDLNAPVVPPNFKEEAMGRIYRESLVAPTMGKFSPKCEYDALPPDLKDPAYIPTNGDTLIGFLESRPAASASFRILYRYVNSRAIADSGRITDDYSTTEGAAWGK